MDIVRIWRDLRSLPRRLRQERIQQEFIQFFGIPPGWTQITQKLVDKRLNQLAWQLHLMQEDENSAPVQQAMEQYIRNAKEVAERCGYMVNPPKKQPETVARKQQRRKSK